MMNAKEIRADIVTRLKGNTAATGNVTSSAIDPIHLKNLPMIVINTPSRIARNIDHTDPTFTKEITIEISGVVGNLTTYADDLDDLLDEIKQILLADSTWYSQFDGLVDEYNEEITLHDEGETNFATGTLTFSVQTFEEWN